MNFENHRYVYYDLGLSGEWVDKTAVVRELALVQFQRGEAPSKSCSPESLDFLLPQKSTSPNFNLKRIKGWCGSSWNSVI